MREKVPLHTTPELVELVYLGSIGVLSARPAKDNARRRFDDLDHIFFVVLEMENEQDDRPQRGSTWRAFL
jgi:hypothetical protein